MSDERLSIAGLEARLRESPVIEHRPAVWVNNEEGGWAAVGPHRDDCRRFSCPHDTGCPDYAKAMADSHCDVTLRRAAPALIAVVKAAMAWRDGTSDDNDYKTQDAVCNALVAALDKVRP